MFRRSRKNAEASLSSSDRVVPEREKRGLQVLYEGEVAPVRWVRILSQSQFTLIDISIILVHGYGGSFLDSWTAENGCCWPRDLLPAEVPHCPVLSWGYDANVVSVGFSKSASKATIHGNARGLLADVNRYRSQEVSIIVHTRH